MDIFADGESFYIGLGMGDFKSAWDEKMHELIVKSDKRGHRDILMVTTYSGVFIEAVDENGAIVMDGGDGNWFNLPISSKPVRLRYKVLPDPGLSKTAVNRARQTVTRYLLSGQPYSLNLPDKMTGVIAWMQKQLEKIPAACRKSAEFSFDATTEYGETYPRIEITYRQKESDEEVIRRVQIERERARIAEESERERLAMLQAKYA